MARKTYFSRKDMADMLPPTDPKDSVETYHHCHDECECASCLEDSAARRTGGHERPLTNEEAREILDSEDLPYSTDAGIMTAQCYGEARTITGLTRSELLTWIKGAA